MSQQKECVLFWIRRNGKSVTKLSEQNKTKIETYIRRATKKRDQEVIKVDIHGAHLFVDLDPITCTKELINYIQNYVNKKLYKMNKEVNIEINYIIRTSIVKNNP
jgi:hypothetical protein